MMKSTSQKPSLYFSTPRELNLECTQLGNVDIKCSQAFPDLTRFNGRFYLAFRAAPSHFPSIRSRILIYSSADAETWQMDHAIDDARDLRDPHFLQFQGQLHLFYISLRRRIFNHQPDQIYYLTLQPRGWSAPQPISTSQAGFWNVKAFGDTVYMSIYSRNGSNQKKAPRHFRFIASKDLRNWETVFDSPLTRERLRSYQTSEASFDFDPQGNIFGTIRSLIYPNLNFRIPAGQPDQWQVRVDRFKCDGPNLFGHNGRTFLVARRSLFYRLSSQPFRFIHHARTALNVLRYSLSRKRTAIYSFDPDGLTIRHITDLPSHGDTGYSAIAPISENQYLLIYYSSNINMKKDLSWIRGQMRQTRLYASTLTVDA